MLTDVLVVMLWQVVLFGAWGLMRRIRRLERTAQPQCYAKLGMLRESMVQLRSDLAFDSDEQARRSRRVTRFTERADAELDVLAALVEQMSQTLMYQTDLLEKYLDIDQPDPAPAPASLTLPEQVES